MTVCMENTFHPQNASALVRNCEASAYRISTRSKRCASSRRTSTSSGNRQVGRYPQNGKHRRSDRRAAGKRLPYRSTSPHTDDRTPENFDVTAGRFALFSARSTPASATSNALCRRIHPHPDVRIRRKPQRLGIGGDPAVPRCRRGSGSRPSTGGFRKTSGTKSCCVG